MQRRANFYINTIENNKQTIMNRIVIVLLSIIVSISAYASDKVIGIVKDDHNEPIIGAVVSWEESSVATTTDVEGQFEIAKQKDKHILTISYIGYKPQSICIHAAGDSLTVEMENDATLAELVVEERKMGTISSRINVLQTQRITDAELKRAACCNLAESFETNPSVDVSYSDAATGARQIKLLGLSGTYVQMLTENYPNFRGAASLYGLDYIPGTWMESIQVSKGTSSVKNGYEALAGQINVEYKKPTTADKFSANIFASDARRIEANAAASFIINDQLSTSVFAHYSRVNANNSRSGY